MRTMITVTHVRWTANTGSVPKSDGKSIRHTHFTRKAAPVHTNAIASKRHTYRHVHTVSNLKVNCFPKAVTKSSASPALLSQICLEGLRKVVCSHNVQDTGLQNTVPYVILVWKTLFTSLSYCLTNAGKQKGGTDRQLNKIMKILPLVRLAFSLVRDECVYRVLVIQGAAEITPTLYIFALLNVGVISAALCICL
jgi:hypothetical protein